MEKANEQAAAAKEKIDADADTYKSAITDISNEHESTVNAEHGTIQSAIQGFVNGAYSILVGVMNDSGTAANTEIDQALAEAIKKAETQQQKHDKIASFLKGRAVAGATKSIKLHEISAKENMKNILEDVSNGELHEEYIGWKTEFTMILEFTSMTGEMFTTQLLDPAQELMNNILSEEGMANSPEPGMENYVTAGPNALEVLKAAFGYQSHGYIVYDNNGVYVGTVDYILGVVSRLVPKSNGGRDLGYLSLDEVNNLIETQTGIWGKDDWDPHFGGYNAGGDSVDPATQTWSYTAIEFLIGEEALAQPGGLGSDILISAQIVTEAVGLVDPTGIADGANALVLVAQGDTAGAAISVAGIITPFGAEKIVKYAKRIPVSKLDEVNDGVQGLRQTARQTMDNSNNVISKADNHVAEVKTTCKTPEGGCFVGDTLVHESGSESDTSLAFSSTLVVLGAVGMGVAEYRRMKKQAQGFIPGKSKCNIIDEDDSHCHLLPVEKKTLLELHSPESLDELCDQLCHPDEAELREMDDLYSDRLLSFDDDPPYRESTESEVAVLTREAIKPSVNHKSTKTPTIPVPQFKSASAQTQLSKGGLICLMCCLLLAAGLFGGGALSPDTASHTTPISEIEVGDNVLAGNPIEAPDLRFGSSVDPETWRKIELRAPKVDGSFADVTLLRPLIWISEQKAATGHTVHISVPECGIKGNAQVLSISACPPVKSGSGKTVTGVFRHSSSKVVDVYVAGLDKPIGATGNHPFWSEDRQEFVRADKLQPGERLRTLKGIARVTNVVARGSPVPVFNIEVQVDHTYRVADVGVLVHNGNTCPEDLLDNTDIVNENIQATNELRRLHPNDPDVLDDALVKGNPSGSYVHTHASGTEYVGKGLPQRATQSAKDVTKRTGDPVVSTKWEPAIDEIEAFSEEARKIRERGGIKNLHNQINSPGENLP